MKTSGLPLAMALAGATTGENSAQQRLNDDQSYNDGSHVVSPDLDAYIEGLMKEWHAAGLAVAIVDGDKTWAKGYGHAVLNSTPVTPHTLFYTGSTTKSFTAAGVSLIIDNPKAYNGLTWQTTISSVLRDDFVLSDDWATAHVTLEDALSHRTGYPRHDFASAADARDNIRKLRHLPMSAEPRAKYQYCNKMFGVAGYLIEKLTGSWLGDFFRQRLWAPMGMNETYFSLGDAENSGLVLADEYMYDAKRDRFLQVPHEPKSGEEGAGSIISNVLDYAKYLRVMMDEAAPLSKDGHREVKTPRSFSAASKPPLVGPVAYSFGWHQGVFEGEQAYFHSGAVIACVSNMIMIPSKKLAVAVMSNSNSRAPELISYRILYGHFGIPDEKRYDLNKGYLSDQKAQQEYLENCADHIYPSIPEPPLLPTLPISDHIGEFSNPGYGTVKVELYCYDEDTVAKDNGRRSIEKCQLRVLGVAGPGFVYLAPSVYLEPKSGNYWVGRGYLEAGDMKEVDTPFWCMRVEFKVDVKGAVTHIGMDARLEGDEGPLVWFERVDNLSSP